jgi:hypothetical protein
MSREWQHNWWKGIITLLIVLEGKQKNLREMWRVLIHRTASPWSQYSSLIMIQFAI